MNSTIATGIRWVTFAVIVYFALTLVPPMVSEYIAYKREDACMDRGMSWQEKGWGSDEYECIEKEETNGSND